MSTLSGTVTDQRLGADLAVREINLDPSILAGDTLEIIHLDDGGEVWGGLRAACELVHSGIHGIVGPTYSSVSLGVARLTTALQVPTVAYSATSPTLSDPTAFQYLARVVPVDTMQAAAMVEVVAGFGWSRICIVYQDDDYGVQGMVQTSSQARLAGMTVLATESFSSITSDTTTAVNRSLALGCRVFVVWCIDCDVAMEGVQNNGGLEAFENFAWIMSDGCSDYSRFSTTQMSGLLGAICVSPAVPEGNGKDAFMAGWDRDANGQPDSYAFYAHDAVWALAHAIDAVPQATASMDLAAQERCLKDPSTSENPWSYGPAVFAALGDVEFRGSTSGNGTVQFSNQERSTAAYRISNVQPYGMDGGIFINVGVVDVVNGVAMSASPVANWSMQWPDAGIRPSDRLSVSTRTLRLLTMASSEPFVYIDPRDPECAQPACSLDDPASARMVLTDCPQHCYVGYSIDVLKVLQANLNFEYTMDHVGKNFSYDGVLDLIGPGAGEWDVAFGDWTATESRSKKYFVSYPFIDVGLGLLTKRRSPVKKETDLNIVLAPFAPDLWYAIIVYFVTMWFLFWVFEHGINPKVADIYWDVGWCEIPWYRVPKRASGLFYASGKRHNKKSTVESADSRAAYVTASGDPEVGRFDSNDHSTNEDDDEITNRQGWLSSMYWTLSTFAHTPDIETNTGSGKFLASGILIANLVLLAAYSANLTANLSRPNINPPSTYNGLESIDDGTLLQERVCAVCTSCTISGFMIDRYGRTCYNCGVNDDTVAWTRDMCMELLQNDTVDAVIHDRPPAVFMSNTLLDAEGRCFLEVIGDPFYVLGFSALGHDGYIIRQFSSAILAARGNGNTTKFEEDSEYRLQPNKCTSNKVVKSDGSTAAEGEDDSFERLTYAQMEPCFAIVGAFTGVAIVWFIIEQIHAWSSQNDITVEKAMEQHQKIVNKRSDLAASVTSTTSTASIVGPTVVVNEVTPARRNKASGSSKEPKSTRFGF
jgi:ABC-type branched-subunit amino acid transport system substrate-binding protein